MSVLFLERAGERVIPTTLPSHLPRLQRALEGSVCYPQASFIFLFPYYRFVKMVYKFSDHADTLFKCFYCESLRYTVNVYPNIGLKPQRSGFKDVTAQLVALS